MFYDNDFDDHPFVYRGGHPDAWIDIVSDFFKRNGLCKPVEIQHENENYFEPHFIIRGFLTLIDIKVYIALNLAWFEPNRPKEFKGKRKPKPLWKRPKWNSKYDGP